MQLRTAPVGTAGHAVLPEHTFAVGSAYANKPVRVEPVYGLIPALRCCPCESSLSGEVRAWTVKSAS